MIDTTHVSFAAAPVTKLRPRGVLDSRMSPCATIAASAQPELDPFLLWLLEGAGLKASAYRTAPLQRRLAACLRQLRVQSSAEARHLLASKPHLQMAALDAALIGVTEFFRDAPVFEALRETVLPELRWGKRHVRVLSAGC
jgi:chemotaxis methyl-accepting protein methylase